MKTATKNFPASSVAFDPVTRTTFSSQYDLFTIGAGYLDVMAALNDTSSSVGPASSPLATFNASNKMVRVVADPASAWMQSQNGGLPLVWGTSVFTSGSDSASGFSLSSVGWGDSVAWADCYYWSVAWGDAFTSFDSVAWGDSVSSGDSTVPGATGTASLRALQSVAWGELARRSDAD